MGSVGGNPKKKRKFEQSAKMVEWTERPNRFSQRGGGVGDGIGGVIGKAKHCFLPQKKGCGAKRLTKAIFQNWKEKKGKQFPDSRRRRRENEEGCGDQKKRG